MAFFQPMLIRKRHTTRDLESGEGRRTDQRKGQIGDGQSRWNCACRADPGQRRGCSAQPCSAQTWSVVQRLLRWCYFSATHGHPRNGEPYLTAHSANASSGCSAGIWRMLPMTGMGGGPGGRWRVGERRATRRMARRMRRAARRAAKGRGRGKAMGRKEEGKRERGMTCLSGTLKDWNKHAVCQVNVGHTYTAAPLHGTCQLAPPIQSDSDTTIQRMHHMHGNLT